MKIYFSAVVLALSLSAYASPATESTGKMNTTASCFWIDASSYGDLNEVISAPQSAGKTVLISTKVDVKRNLIVSGDRTLKFVYGGSLNFLPGVNIAIMGGIEAGPFQIFAGSGSVTFGGRIQEVYSEWWGAAADQHTDSSAAIQKALDTHKPVQLLPGVYHLMRPLDIAASDVRLRGAGMHLTTLDCNGIDYGIRSSPNRFINGVMLEDFTIRGAKIDGISLKNVVERSSIINGVGSSLNGRHGFYFSDCHGLIVNRCEARDNRDKGFFANYSQAAIFTKCRAVANNDGFFLQSGAQTTIEDSWAEANYRYQMYIGRINGFILQNNWIETHDKSSKSALFISNSRKKYTYGVVTGNFIGGTFGVDSADCITVEEGEKITIFSNRTQGGRRAAIYLGADTSEISVSNNTMLGYSQGDGGIVNLGVRNTIK